MPKNDDIQKHTLNLRRGDHEFLGDVFASRGLKPGVVIRQLVSNYVDQLKTRMEKEDE